MGVAGSPGKTTWTSDPGGGAAWAELAEVRQIGGRLGMAGECVAPAIGAGEEGKSGEVLAAP